MSKPASADLDFQSNLVSGVFGLAQPRMRQNKATRGESLHHPRATCHPQLWQRDCGCEVTCKRQLVSVTSPKSVIKVAAGPSGIGGRDGFKRRGGGEALGPDRAEPDMVSRLSAVDLVGMKQEKQTSHLCWGIVDVDKTLFRLSELHLSPGISFFRG